MSRPYINSFGAALGSFALALVCLQSKSAYAAPKDSLVTDYYSNSSKTVQVGQKIVSCFYPFVTITGTVTAYQTTYDVQNCGPDQITSAPNADELGSLPEADDIDSFPEE